MLLPDVVGIGFLPASRVMRIPNRRVFTRPFHLGEVVERC